MRNELTVGALVCILFFGLCPLSTVSGSGEYISGTVRDEDGDPITSGYATFHEVNTDEYMYTDLDGNGQYSFDLGNLESTWNDGDQYTITIHSGNYMFYDWDDYLHTDQSCDSADFTGRLSLDYYGLPTGYYPVCVYMMDMVDHCQAGVFISPNINSNSNQQPFKDCIGIAFYFTYAWHDNGKGQTGITVDIEYTMTAMTSGYDDRIAHMGPNENGNLEYTTSNVPQHYDPGVYASYLKSEANGNTFSFSGSIGWTDPGPHVAVVGSTISGITVNWLT